MCDEQTFHKKECLNSSYLTLLLKEYLQSPMTMADRNISITLITMFSLPLLYNSLSYTRTHNRPSSSVAMPQGRIRALQKSKDQFMVNANFKVISIIHGC